MTRNSSPPFQAAVSWDGVVATVTVTGQVDCTTAPALASRLREIGAAHPERLVLDLDGLFFTDVASARALTAPAKPWANSAPSSCEHRPGPPPPAGLRPHRTDRPRLPPVPRALRGELPDAQGLLIRPDHADDEAFRKWPVRSWRRRAIATYPSGGSPLTSARSLATPMIPDPRPPSGRPVVRKLACQQRRSCWSTR
jgi:hypothetical protein